MVSIQVLQCIIPINTVTVPVTLVDYYRADYAPPQFSPNDNSLYQFYFVFLREVAVGIDNVEVYHISNCFNTIMAVCRELVNFFCACRLSTVEWQGFAGYTMKI